MIFHWCDEKDWDPEAIEYVALSLEIEGFIHFSFKHQVGRTATAVDRGRNDLVLLCVDETHLEVVVEDCYEIGEGYPHIYGPLPTSSVVGVYQFPPGPDGAFQLPPGLD